MAKKKIVERVIQVVGTCGQCEKAYGFCNPGYDGRPIMCRCDNDPENFKMCSQKACLAFSLRATPAPEKVVEHTSANRHADKVREKVVPVFGDPESKRPTELVPASEMLRRYREAEKENS